ncbi:hypothetical protein [Algoriphagus namhaensis]
MKNQLLLALATVLVLSACTSEAPKAPLSEQNLEFEIYDSLVVDYLGNVTLMDISPDGKTFLLIDQNTDSLLLADGDGQLIQTYMLAGEGPENYPKSRLGVGKFLNNDQFLIPTMGGLFVYDLKGRLNKRLEPDFAPQINVLMPYSEAHFLIGNRVYLHFPGRMNEEDLADMNFNQNATLLEVLDLETGKFEGQVNLPKESRFAQKDESINVIDFFPNLTAREDSIFIAFRNEPKLFGYQVNQLNSTPKTWDIPLEGFIENTSWEGPKDGSIDLRRFFFGSINDLYALNSGEFLINYQAGLSDEVAAEVMSVAGSDFNKIFKLGGEKNKGGYILFDLQNSSPIIKKPEVLGSINKVISRDEIWFSLDFANVEQDYTVIYKTRIISR